MLERLQGSAIAEYFWIFMSRRSCETQTLYMCARRGRDLRGCDVLGIRVSEWVSCISHLCGLGHLENGQTGLLSTCEREVLFPRAGVCV